MPKLLNTKEDFPLAFRADSPSGPPAFGVQREKCEAVIDGIKVTKDWCDEIPVLYRKPSGTVAKKKLAIWLSGLGGTKEALVPYLKDISDLGYTALAFDLYQHGERGNETKSEIMARVFSNMRRYGWPILGQTVLDTERVVDWAIESLGVEPEFHMGGISMGGDITIAVAGIDRRMVRGAPVVATPDWLRPGMHSLEKPDELLDPGCPDTYANFFCDCLNPITHLDRYAKIPPMRFTLGGEDNHIPPENAERFKRELAAVSTEAAGRVEINYILAEGEKKANHRDVIDRKEDWWPELKGWWLG